MRPPLKLPLKVLDTHCHLAEVAERDAAVAEAAAAGVAMVTMGHDLGTSREAIALAEASEWVWAGVGHHAMNTAGPDIEAFRALLRHPRVAAVGEVGLDASEDSEYGPLDKQVEWFDAMIGLSVEAGLPLSIHVRGTEEAVHQRLKAHPGAFGVMHYFALDRGWAERFLDLGFHLSFAGLVTRPSRTELREVAAWCPADRLLLETDAPWGKPNSRRKEAQNRPAFIWDTAKLVAELRHQPVDELAAQELANARQVFQKALA